MYRARISRCAFVAGLLVLTAAHANAAQDARQIINKAKNAIKGLKSYQARIDMSLSMGQMGGMSMNADFKTVPTSGKSAMVMTVNNTRGAQSQKANIQVVDDGTSVFSYYKQQNTYTKQPHQATNNIDPLEMFNRMFGESDLTYLRSEKVNGRPAHVIKIQPRNPRPGAAQMNALVYVDQATNRYRQVSLSQTMALNPNAPPQTMTMKLQITNEVVNASIPDSAFKFVPPAGAKLSQGGTMGIGGMMGGGAGRGPARR